MELLVRLNKYELIRIMIISLVELTFMAVNLMLLVIYYTDLQLAIKKTCNTNNLIYPSVISAVINY